MRTLAPLIGALLALAGGCAAEQKIMVAVYKVDFGKLDAYVEAINKAATPALDRLLEDGVIQAYGVDLDALHSAGQPNVAAWFSASTYGNLQKADDAVLAAIGAHPAEAKVLLESADMNAHEDYLLEAVMSKFGRIPAGAKPVSTLSQMRIKPGKMKEWRQASEKYFKPIYDKLVDDGAIYSYQALVQGVHTKDPGDVWLLVQMPDMGAIDKLDQAFEARMQAMTPAERSIFENLEATLLVESAHRDGLMRSAIFRTK